MLNNSLTSHSQAFGPPLRLLCLKILSSQKIHCKKQYSIVKTEMREQGFFPKTHLQYSGHRLSFHARVSRNLQQSILFCFGKEQRRGKLNRSVVQLLKLYRFSVYISPYFQLPFSYLIFPFTCTSPTYKFNLSCKVLFKLPLLLLQHQLWSLAQASHAFLILGLVPLLDSTLPIVAS